MQVSSSGVADGDHGGDFAIGLVLGLRQLCSTVLSDLSSSLLALLSRRVSARGVDLISGKNSVTHVLHGVVKGVSGANVFREKMSHLSLVVPMEPAALFAFTVESEPGELSFGHPLGASKRLDASTKVGNCLLGLGFGLVT